MGKRSNRKIGYGVNVAIDAIRPMLGRLISNPFNVETNRKSIAGLGLLNVETTIEKGKLTSQVEARLFQKDLLLWKTGKILGYEIGVFGILSSIDR